MISLLECTLITVGCHPYSHPHTPLLPSFNCVQNNLSENPNLTCRGLAQVQTPQMTPKSFYDLPFAYILVWGLPNFSLHLKCKTPGPHLSDFDPFHIYLMQHNLEKHCSTASASLLASLHTSHAGATWSPRSLSPMPPTFYMCYSLFLEWLLLHPPGKSRRINYFSRPSSRFSSFDLLKGSKSFLWTTIVPSAYFYNICYPVLRQSVC